MWNRFVRLKGEDCSNGNPVHGFYRGFQESFSNFVYKKDFVTMWYVVFC